MSSAKSAKAKAMPTTVEWSDESCHLSKKQMKTMGFGSTQEMMEHYYDCKPGETKYEILRKSVRAMKCVLGRIGRMLHTPVKPNDANSGLYDTERDAHLYQIVLAFLYGKKCLKNALNNLDASQLDVILGIYTSLVNDAFNEAPMNPRIRNLRPIEEEGPEGVYHQLHEGRFSIDHLIEHLKKKPDVRNPRKLVDDPVINEIINSMDILLSNPKSLSTDPRIYGKMLHEVFEKIAGNKFKKFSPNKYGEVLRYNEEVMEEVLNDELARALVLSKAASERPPHVDPIAEGGAGSERLAVVKASAPVKKGKDKKKKPATKIVNNEENFNALLNKFKANIAADAAEAEPAAEEEEPPINVSPEILREMYNLINQIILNNFGEDTLQNIDATSLPQKDGKIYFEYELSIKGDMIDDPALGGLIPFASLDVVKNPIPHKYPKGICIYKGNNDNIYYYRALKPITSLITLIPRIGTNERNALTLALSLQPYKNKSNSNRSETKRRHMSSGRRRTRKHLR